jgi:L-2-hydroxyglutarate oxidase LhgO
MDEDVFSYDETNVDFWKHHLIPDESQLWEMYNAVRTYLPNVDRSKFRPDYVGIRPKLVPPAGGFQDFIFRRDFASSFRRGDPKTDRDRSKYAHGQMLTLMGIESPGLTASLAIAEKVVDMVEGRDS